MKLSGRSQGVLYGLTAVGCLIWLLQSANEAWLGGTFMTWTNLVFLACLVVVVGYASVAAARCFTSGSKQANETEGAVAAGNGRYPDSVDLGGVDGDDADR
jgi:hypothetical protein